MTSHLDRVVYTTSINFVILFWEDIKRKKEGPTLIQKWTIFEMRAQDEQFCNLFHPSEKLFTGWREKRLYSPHTLKFEIYAFTGLHSHWFFCGIFFVCSPLPTSFFLQQEISLKVDWEGKQWIFIYRGLSAHIFTFWPHSLIGRKRER